MYTVSHRDYFERLITYFADYIFCILCKRQFIHFHGLCMGESFPYGKGDITDFGVDPVGVRVGLTHVCTISGKPVVGFLPNFHGYIIGT